MRGIEDIAAVEDDRAAHHILDAIKVWISKCLPLRHEQQCIGTHNAFVVARCKFDTGSDRGAEPHRGALYSLTSLRSDPLREMHTRGG
jgi:hypothetical protein